MQNPVNGKLKPEKHSSPNGMPDDVPDESRRDAGEVWAPYMRSTSLISSFGYAVQGLAYTFRTQRNFKIHAVITLVVVVAGLVLQVSSGEWVPLAIVIGLVFQTELTNTAVEAIVDKVSPEFHELAKVAKDSSAAAVLVTAIAAVIVGVAVFGHHLWNLLAVLVH